MKNTWDLWAEAIAENLLQMSTIKTPIISIIIGEGGSGGALALAIGDRVLMLEHSVYSVISPEGCAAILWKKNTWFSTKYLAMLLLAKVQLADFLALR